MKNENDTQNDEGQAVQEATDVPQAAERPEDAEASQSQTTSGDEPYRDENGSYHTTDEEMERARAAAQQGDVPEPAKIDMGIRFVHRSALGKFLQVLMPVGDGSFRWTDVPVVEEEDAGAEIVTR